MGRPLFDDSRETSSSMTSQCSASKPPTMRTMSAAIQFFGAPWPEKRPWTITNSPSATMSPGSYFSVGGVLLIRLKNPLTTRLNVSAMLDVVGRPIVLGRNIVALVEQGIERFKDQRLVALFGFGGHVLLLSLLSIS